MDFILSLGYILFFNIVYIFIGIYLAAGKNKFPNAIMALLFFIFFNNYLFRSLNIHIDVFKDYFIAYSSSREISFILFFITSVIIFPYKMLKKENISKISTLVIISSYGMVTGLIKGASLLNTLTIVFREMTLPLLFFHMINILKPENKSFRYFNYFAIFLILLHTIEANYTETFLKPVMDSIWYSSLITDSGEYYLAQQNLFRDGSLRAIGFFVSPIEYNITLMFFIFLSLYYVIFSKKINHKIIFLLFLSFFLRGMYLTHTRSGYIVIFTGLLALLLIYSNKISLKYKKIVSFSIPISYISFTFFYLATNIFTFMKDSSSEGRVPQYLWLYAQLTTNLIKFFFGVAGEGLNLTDKRGLAIYDSNIINSAINFGIIGALIYLGLYINIYFKLVSYFNYVKASNDVHFKALYFSVLSFYVCYFYLFFFQYTFFTAIHLFLLISSALLLNRCESEKQNAEKFIIKKELLKL